MAKDYSDLKYLLELLDDDNEEVYRIVHRRIIDYGEDILPELKNVWRNTDNVLLFERVDYLIKEISRINNSKRFKEWLSATKSRDILDGILYLSRMHNPDLDEKEIKEKINLYVKDIWLELNNNLTSLEKINLVNHFLFKEYKFKVEKTAEEYNHFFEAALNVKKLNEVSSSILYFYLCDKLEIDVVPVMVKNRILLGYVGNGFTDFDENKVIFLISPENNGTVISADRINFSTGKPRDLIKYWLTTAILLINDKNRTLAAEYRDLLKILMKTQV